MPSSHDSGGTHVPPLDSHSGRVRGMFTGRTRQKNEPYTVNTHNKMSENNLFNWTSDKPVASIAASVPSPASLKSNMAPSTTPFAVSSYVFGPYGTMLTTFVLLLILQPPFVCQRSSPHDLSYTRLFSWVIAAGLFSAAAHLFFSPVE